MGRSELIKESRRIIAALNEESRIIATLLEVVGLLTMVGGFAEAMILGASAGTVMMVSGVIGIVLGAMMHINLRLKRLEQQRIGAP